MMRFNEQLEEVVSLDQLSDNIHGMMSGVGCNAYFCCLNKRDLAYIENTGGDGPDQDVTAFDDCMVALAGNSERTGKVSRLEYPLRELAPVPVLPGDMVMVLPITHRTRVFGYMVFLNERIPLEVFNYRICQENIGSSIENLHRQMVLRSSIAELDRLHIRDQLTGLYNRFALQRFAGSYTSRDRYTVVMLDLDDLKGVNDHYGHLAGNHMISMAAEVIRGAMGEDDVIIRYGGDEFLVLSACTEESAWEERRERINRELEDISRRQALPYHPGISMGYAVCGGSVPISEAIGQADNRMYMDKKTRKAGAGPITKQP
jgi:diguanylate cyclase (GGDEF)-like protein